MSLKLTEGASRALDYGFGSYYFKGEVGKRDHAVEVASNFCLTSLLSLIKTFFSEASSVTLDDSVVTTILRIDSLYGDSMTAGLADGAEKNKLRYKYAQAKKLAVVLTGRAVADLKALEEGQPSDTSFFHRKRVNALMGRLGHKEHSEFDPHPLASTFVINCLYIAASLIDLSSSSLMPLRSDPTSYLSSALNLLDLVTHGVRESGYYIYNTTNATDLTTRGPAAKYPVGYDDVGLEAFGPCSCNLNPARSSLSNHVRMAGVPLLKGATSTAVKKLYASEQDCLQGRDDELSALRLAFQMVPCAVHYVLLRYLDVLRFKHVPSFANKVWGTNLARLDVDFVPFIYWISGNAGWVQTWVKGGINTLNDLGLSGYLDKYEDDEMRELLLRVAKGTAAIFGLSYDSYRQNILLTLRDGKEKKLGGEGVNNLLCLSDLFIDLVLSSNDMSASPEDFGQAPNGDTETTSDTSRDESGLDQNTPYILDLNFSVTADAPDIREMSPKELEPVRGADAQIGLSRVSARLMAAVGKDVSIQSLDGANKSKKGGSKAELLDSGSKRRWSRLMRSLQAARYESSDREVGGPIARAVSTFSLEGGSFSTYLDRVTNLIGEPADHESEEELDEETATALHPNIQACGLTYVWEEGLEGYVARVLNAPNWRGEPGSEALGLMDPIYDAVVDFVISVFSREASATPPENGCVKERYWYEGRIQDYWVKEENGLTFYYPFEDMEAIQRRIQEYNDNNADRVVNTWSF